jgi:3-oxoacyl-[acyl-carrier protein] reductase
VADYGLKGRIAVITGGGRGIGRGIALALAREGANVVIADVLAEHAQKTAREAEAEGVGAMATVADVSDKAQVNRLVEDTIRSFGRVDILINNAGVSPKKDGAKVTVVEMDTDEWERVIGVNLHGSFYCARACAREMVKQGYGKIINMSSLAGRTYSAIPGAHYLASKAAVIGLTRALAGELAPYGINVNAIAPGRIESEMIRDVPSEVNELYLQKIPVNRLGTHEDIANTALFLVSDLAGYITGVTVDVNGGSLML